MNKLILIILLIIALTIAFVAIIYYNLEDYEYKLDLKEKTSANEVYITLHQGGGWNGFMSSFSLALGEMNFENKHDLPRYIRVPHLVACVNLSSTLSYSSIPPNVNPHLGPYFFTLWPVYSTEKLTLNDADYTAGHLSSSEYAEIQRQYGVKNRKDEIIELKKDEKLKYFIYLKYIELGVFGDSSEYLKNMKIEIYQLPDKQYDKLIKEIEANPDEYPPPNADCSKLSNQLPLKTIYVE